MEEKVNCVQNYPVTFYGSGVSISVRFPTFI